MTNFSSISGGQLRQFVERIERLEEEKSALTTDIREVYAEAKSHGFDPKIMRKVVGLRKMNQDERMEYEELLAIYMNALSMRVAASSEATPDSSASPTTGENISQAV